MYLVFPYFYILIIITIIIFFVRFGFTLLERTPENDRVSMIGSKKKDTEGYDPHNDLKAGFLSLEIRMMEDYFAKEILIMDCTHSTAAHAARFSLPLIKKFVTVLLVGA